MLTKMIDMPLTKPSKKAIDRAVKTLDITKMGSGSIVWYLVVKHKFPLVVISFIVYFMFVNFGTVIIGLFESL